MIADARIKVLIVEDCNVVGQSIAHVLRSDPRMQVIGMARNGREALRFVSTSRPDVILMDIEMPVMDGLEATRRIMETRPVPIIICSVRVGRCDALATRQLLETGAVACIEPPRCGNHQVPDASAVQLLQTVKLMSEVKVVRRWPRMRCVAGSAPMMPADLATPANAGIEFIGIGASTGGPPVIKTILDGLPKGFAVPLLVVQHIARGFLSGLAQWLNQDTGIEVQVAADGMSPQPGCAYLAPDDRHMGINAAGTIVLVEDEPVNGVRPSVSHLFESLASACGPCAAGVLLTGMGRDGAQALKRMRECGATTIAQDRASSVIHGMPGHAIALDAASRVLPAREIAPALIALADRQNHPQGGLS